MQYLVGLTKNKLLVLWTTSPHTHCLCNNYITMEPSDNGIELSEVSNTFATPFSVVARSAKHTRNAATRRPAVPPKPSQNRPAPQVQTITTSDIHSSLVTIPTSVTKRSVSAGVMDEERKSSEDSSSGVSLLQTPNAGIGFSQTSGKSLKRPRAKTSHIHEYITTREGNFVCNRCSRVYKSTGGTGAIARHLKKAHSIDPTASALAEKRKREGTAIDAAIIRGAEINTRAEERRKEELKEMRELREEREEQTGTTLNKTTLEYLYLQWIMSQDISFKQVRNKAFRTFLEYVNPVANRMLPDSEFTLKIPANGLLAEKISEA